MSIVSRKSFIVGRNIEPFTQGSDKTEIIKILTALFNAIDDGDGFLTPEELIRIEKNAFAVISKEEAEEIIATWDSNGDGKMNIEEYIEYKTATLSRRMSIR